MKELPIYKVILGRKVLVRPIRKVCEHLCFLGAAADFLCAIIHFELAIVVIIAKAGFAAGAVGVYLMHAEERLHID